MRPYLSSSRLLFVAVWAMGLGVTFHAAHALIGFGGHSLGAFTDKWVYQAVELIAVAVCASRVLRRREDRWAWALISFGLLTWMCGDLIWTIWLDNVANPPFPSLADCLYLAMFPAVYGGLMLLIRSRLPSLGAAQWLDGAVVGLTIAAIGARLVFPSILAVSKGHPLADAVNLAYPLGDLTLLIFVVVAFSLSGWRPGRVWRLIGTGIGLSAVADLIYAYQAAKGTYVDGGILDTMWPASMSLLALAAWQPIKRQIASPIAPQTIVLSLIAGGVSLALLIDAAFQRVTAAAVILAAGALLATTVRALLTYIENVRMLRRMAHDAVTDGLSGLGNRRRLMGDLERTIRHADHEQPSTLVFFDLNGFKRYNDSFGHAVGDALLARVGVALRVAIDTDGRAYRIGGDEFCALLDGRFAPDHPLLAGALSALTERGDAFTVSASLGLAVIPDDAVSASEALQLADERMYANKAHWSRSSRVQTRDVLLQLLGEATPGLREHVRDVGQLVTAVGRELSLNAEQLNELLRAAELHDIGKLAIPDEIVNKPGPLTADDWRFMRQHPIIGERILNVSPPLRPVARLVRSSHERWDGYGYPDGLAGTEIPLGARIIAVCDAYNAMTSNRCYESARSSQEALAELVDNAGTQFDPQVVGVLHRQLSECELPEPFPAREPATSGLAASIATPNSTGSRLSLAR